MVGLVTGSQTLVQLQFPKHFKLNFPLPFSTHRQPKLVKRVVPVLSTRTAENENVDAPNVYNNNPTSLLRSHSHNNDPLFATW